MSFARLEQFIFEQIARTKLPGMAVAVLADDQITWSKGVGFRDLARGLPATPHTLYGIASITKSFTALAIMQLAEAGKLALDDPVEDHIPFKIHPGGELVRIRHFLSHTSGIPALGSSESSLRALRGADSHWLPLATYTDFLTFMDEAGEWSLNKPGERWFYFNEGYALLGYIIEGCAGMTYQEYITQRILKPLGMSRTFFDEASVTADKDAATPYLITRDGERLASTFPFRPVASGGGLVSNVLDLGNYIRMFLNQGRVNGQQIVSAESIKTMQAPRIPTPQLDSPFGDFSYGYGLRIVADFLGHQLIGHSGSVGVFTSNISFIPEQNIGIAVLTNGSGYAPANIALVGLAIMLDENPDDLPFVRRARLLDELEGRYDSYKGTMRALVRRSGDFLIYEQHDKFNDERVTLIPDTLTDDHRQFYTLQDGHRLPVEFRVKDDRVDLIYERYLLRKTGDL